MNKAQSEQQDNKEILRYLGYRGQELPAEISAQIDECRKLIAGAADPKIIYRQIPVIKTTQAGVDTGEIFFPGCDISVHLKDCDRAIVMAATLGAGVEKLLLRNGVSDMTGALIMDACATQLIEQFCDIFENKTREKLAAEGLFLTGRFSPGYGDLPIEIQGEFCALLDTARKIGLTVSKSSMLNPRKSVTAILGISEKPLPLSPADCEGCGKRDECEFKKEGKKCHE